MPTGLDDAIALQLAPGHAFFVNAKSNSETFTFSNASQNHNDGTATFYKNSNVTPTILLNLTNGTSSKKTTVKFLDNATSGLDVGYDVGAYQDGTPSFSVDTHLVSGSKGIDFTIQCLPTKFLGEVVAIPLSISAAVNDKLSFSASTANIPEGVHEYLEDRSNNTSTKLTGT